MAKVCPPECLQIVLSAGCCGIPLLIEEDTVANDQRVLAHVSCEEGAVRKKKKSSKPGTPNYLRLYFPTGKAEPVMTGTVVDAEAA